ncbi:NAD(P)/FAD-dependent oxidoreductase [Aegicerativicinus sediminis]
MEKVDVLVIGAGPAGSVAAAYLNLNGIKVKVVEKSQFPRFVIGESLLPRSMEHFEEVGLIDILKKEGFEIKSGARFIKGDRYCNFDFSEKFSPGWDWTWQVPRDRFDSVIIEEVMRRGVDVEFNSEVLEIEHEQEYIIAKIKSFSGTNWVRAKFVIDASGYGQVLPRLLNLIDESYPANFSSIFTHVEDINRPKGREGTLITFDVIRDDTWFWVIPFSNGITSLGFVGPTELLTKQSPILQFRELLELSDHYKNRFSDFSPLFDIKSINGYSHKVKSLVGDRFVLVGNSAAFLDPVFSSGVMFATESSLLAAKLVYNDLQHGKVDWQRDYVDYIEKGISVFSTYVNEWYTGNLQKIFFHSNTSESIKKQICSVLAGYVWDDTNPFVANHKRLVPTVAHIIDLENETQP